MEPVSEVDEDLRQVQAELSAREPIFHRPEFDATRDVLESMTAPDFWEVGASGRVYSRQFVIDTVLARGKSPHDHSWAKDDVRCQALGSDLYLFSYRLTQGDRITRRATLWRRTERGWVIVYHQGTPISE